MAPVEVDGGYLEVVSQESVTLAIEFIKETYDTVIAKAHLCIGLMAVVAHGSGTFEEGDAYELAEDRATKRALDRMKAFRHIQNKGQHHAVNGTDGVSIPADSTEATPDDRHTSVSGEDLLLDVTFSAPKHKNEAATPSEIAVPLHEEDDRDDYPAVWTSFTITDFIYQDDATYVDPETRARMIVALHERRLSVVGLLEHLYDLEIVASRRGQLRERPQRRSNLMDIQQGLADQLRDYIGRRDRGEYEVAA